MIISLKLNNRDNNLNSCYFSCLLALRLCFFLYKLQKITISTHSIIMKIKEDNIYNYIAQCR